MLGPDHPNRQSAIPVTKLLAQSVTVWNRRRCLCWPNAGNTPDKSVGDHGGLLVCAPVAPL
jgi:hypothetical protein